MKDKIKDLKHQLAKERKELKRRKRNKKYSRKLYNNKFTTKKYEFLRNSRISSFANYCYCHFYDEKLVSTHFNAPETLCLETNNNQTLHFLKVVFSSLFHHARNTNEELEISFKNCNVLKLAPLMFLNITITDFFDWRRKTSNSGINFDHLPKLGLDPEMSIDINNILVTMHFPVNVKDEKKGKLPIFGYKLIKGKVLEKDYKENSKGKISQNLRNYINQCLRIHGVELNSDGESSFDSMIGEILANADDHSVIDTWFVYASYSIFNDKKFENDNNNGFIGELSLVFMNFGPSIFEGFENSKHLIQDSFSEMGNLYSKAINSKVLRKKFPFESMITLYALQEGYSRLLYEDISRGAGTMTFIRAFLDLGYEESKFESILYILSGKSLIKCESRFTPFLMDNRYYLSLNKENDLSKPPLQENVKTLDKKFPGTILLTKLYLYHDHLVNKITKSGT